MHSKCASEVTRLNLYGPPHVPVAHLIHVSMFHPLFTALSYGFKVLAHKRHRSVRPGRQSKARVCQISLALDFCLPNLATLWWRITRELVYSWWSFNPFEKYARQNGFIFPHFKGWKFKKNVWNHHLVVDLKFFYKGNNETHPPKFICWPLKKLPKPNRKGIVFQPPFFRGLCLNLGGVTFGKPQTACFF